jgi:5-methylcytosine-specific restriction endonuclease McrA
MCRKIGKVVNVVHMGSKWIRPEKRFAIYLRDEFTCQYCGTDLRSASAEEVTLDHLKPRIKGGSNAESNLVTACRACNSSRQDRPWTEFAPGGAHERIRRTIRRKLDVTAGRDFLVARKSSADAPVLVMRLPLRNAA